MIDEKSAPLYAKLNIYKILVEKTEIFIQESLSKVKNPYVACSFGKDSSVMLHLILKFSKDIKVICVQRTETELVDNYNEIINQWDELNLKIITGKGFLEGNKKKSFIRYAVSNLNEFDSYFVGIRVQESVPRRITLSTHGVYYLNKDNKIRICPMAWWKIDDIATYTLVNKLPTLNTYKHEGFEARTATCISSRFPHESLRALKSRDIASFNKLLKLLPEARYYV